MAGATKTTAKRAPAKAVKKAAPKKVPAKKPVAKKAAAPTLAAQKKAASVKKSTAAKKVPAKRAPAPKKALKAPAKKKVAAVKKAPAKKAAPKKQAKRAGATAVKKATKRTPAVKKKTLTKVASPAKKSPVARTQVVTEVPAHYYCAITHAVLKDPVKAADGFIYERSAITKWLEKNKRSPMTNKHLDNERLHPDRALCTEIDTFCEKYPHLIDQRGSDEDGVPEGYKPADAAFRPFGYGPGGVSDEDDVDFHDDFDGTDEDEEDEDDFTLYNNRQCEGITMAGHRCQTTADSHGVNYGRDWGAIAAPLRNGSRFCTFHQNQDYGGYSDDEDSEFWSGEEEESEFWSSTEDEGEDGFFEE